MRFTRKEGRLQQRERHPGQFPVLMPNGEAYVYADHGWLVSNDSKVKRNLFRVPDVVGGIRVSPDDRFVAFGVKADRHTMLSHIEICELSSKVCVAGPEYDEWIPGRETFWIKP